MKVKLFLLFFVFTLLFTYFSYSVAKERWQQTDFDTTVKLQDHINPERSRKIDEIFSYFSLIGSAEVTVGFCLVMMFLLLIRKRLLAAIGWMMIVPASVAEIFGKLVVFHPGPPVLFHRSILPTHLPSFYVHTDFSYPSGHMTRTIFIITIFAVMMVFSTKNYFHRATIFICLVFFALMMGVTRVYLGEHWSSDVIGGGLLGAALGLFASVLILQPKKV